MRQLNNKHLDTIEGASAHQGEIVSSQFAPSCQKDENQMNELILKGLGKRKVRSILNKWIKDQINVCLEFRNGRFSFDSTIHLDQYGVDGFDEDGMLVDELFKFIGNRI